MTQKSRIFRYFGEKTSLKFCWKKILQNLHDIQQYLQQEALISFTKFNTSIQKLLKDTPKTILHFKNCANSLYVSNLLPMPKQTVDIKISAHIPLYSNKHKMFPFNTNMEKWHLLFENIFDLFHFAIQLFLKDFLVFPRTFWIENFSI